LKALMQKGISTVSPEFSQEMENRSLVKNIMSKRVKSFSSLMAHRVAVISVPLALSQTPAYTAKTMDTGPVHRTVCPFTPGG